jgi:anti-sigma regulatory factor (Ser/Thr protein kinase)
MVEAEFASVLPETVLERIKLLVSEFVTNRIVGGKAGREDDELIVDVSADEVVRCTVVDHGAAAVPPQCVLGMLDKLSVRWGLTRTDDMTRVWFEAEASAA